MTKSMYRQARASRILDVAAKLLLRHGYSRVTMDDIARAANLGKGTIYLHWRTREKLFSEVFEREVREAIHALVEALLQDPGVFRLHRLARAYFLAIMERPLLRGFVLGDPELLGRLIRADGAREDRHRAILVGYFELLVQQGLLHIDLDAQTAAYAFLATFEGFLRAQGSGDRPELVQLERQADLLAFTVRRAFESGREVPPARQKHLARRVIDLLRGPTATDRSDAGGAI